jgi:hypothetical protein
VKSMMKAMWSVPVVLMLCGCQASEPVTGTRVDAHFKVEFLKWEAEVTRQLEAGRSWIIFAVDDKFTKYLVANAHKQESFLREKLKQNMFVSLILDESEVLNQKYNHPSKECRGSMQDRQAAWLNLNP